MPNRTAAVAGQNKTKSSITYSKTELTLDKVHEDENKVFRQLVFDIDEGIEVQSYWITTQDNYRLKLFRLVKAGKKPGPPVLLQHGLFENAEKFVWVGHRSIAIQFLESGFDVWIGNNRGSIYSRFNDKLDP